MPTGNILLELEGSLEYSLLRTARLGMNVMSDLLRICRWVTHLSLYLRKRKSRLFALTVNVTINRIQGTVLHI